MKYKIFIYFVMLIVVAALVSGLGSCTMLRQGYVKVHKPKNRNKPYNPKKDKTAKRLKIVRMKN